MERVTGVRGRFFNSPDPAALGRWYREHVGVEVQSWAGATEPGRFGRVMAPDGTSTRIELWQPAPDVAL